MVQVLIGIILIVLALQSKFGKKIMIGKRGIWLEDKNPKASNTQQTGNDRSTDKGTDK